MSRLRVALLGTAHIHLPDHLDVLRSDPDVELVAVYRGDRGVPVPGAREVTDPVDALRSADAAVVDSTTAEHAVLLPRVVAAGVPALVEKPLTSTRGSTRWLAALLDVSPVPVTTAMFLRCAPALRVARRALDDLGELVSAHARLTHPGLCDGALREVPWMLDPRCGGVGGFADLAVHLLDLLLWLRPGTRLTACAAALRPAAGLPVDSGGAALVDWGGTPTTLHAGWTARPGGFHLHVEGTAGSLTVHGGTLTVRGTPTTAPGTLTTTPGTPTTTPGTPTTAPGTRHFPPPAAGDALVAFLAHLRGRPAWEPATTADMTAVADLVAALTAGDATA
ncbi:Gfo/Idh/MocA family protein [Saccharothrix sp. Mg75]|uniref:Gfo/Idh/MocA family protein n=1 Tax=Saccharothrix sp. Mg75 TaxID=3445357 RepID=UPI003EEFAE17